MTRNNTQCKRNVDLGTPEKPLAQPDEIAAGIVAVAVEMCGQERQARELRKAAAREYQQLVRLGRGVGRGRGTGGRR